MVNLFSKLGTIGVCLLLATSCNSAPQPKAGGVTKANAVVNPTEGNKVWGNITFVETPKGVQVIADVQGLVPVTKHGFHIHEYGDCSAPDANSAGGHFNPGNNKHGGPTDKDRHAGDLGNLESDNQGRAKYERLDKTITLNGPDSIIGKSVIIHEKEDDFKTQPSGNAGKRLACGLILPIEE